MKAITLREPDEIEFRHRSKKQIDLRSYQGKNNIEIRSIHIVISARDTITFEVILK